MLDDITGNIMFKVLEKRSQDSFTPVTWAHCEPALIFEENWVLVVDMLFLVFFGK